MRLAITSMAEGKDWEEISAFSFPTFERYAKRIGACFAPLKGRQLPNQFFHWEKLFCASLLDSYDRVMWIDADAIIKSTAPSIFEIVPEDALGAFDEGLIVRSSDPDLATGAAFYGVSVKPLADRFPKYFNAGMMVFSKIHRPMFEVPARFFSNSHVPEQTYVNTQFQKLGLKFHDLGKIWNGYFSWHPYPGQREEFHIIHYAGWPKAPGWTKVMLEEMNRDYR